MKRYWLFMGIHCYPQGGIDDLIGSYDTIELAVEASENESNNDWGYVYDAVEEKCVWELHQTHFI